MASVTMKAPGIGTFQYNPDSGIALPPGATQVDAPAVPKANIPSAAPASQTGTIPNANIPKPPSFDESYRNLGAEDQFKIFQSNPDIAQHEYGRINDAINRYKALGDTNSLNLANKWLDQFNTVTGGEYKPVDPSVQQFNDYQKQMGDLMTQLKSFAQPMQYNPATDPQAIAYKQYYDNLAKQGSQNAMEEMNSLGLLNSSMTAGEIAKAEQDAGLAYGTKVADLGQQFYQRQQDQFNNTARLIGLLGDQQQRGMDNAYREKTFAADQAYRNNMLGLEQNKFDYQKLQDQIKNGQWDKQFDLEMQKFADDHGYKWAQLDLDEKKALAQIALDQQRVGIEGMNANTAAARLAWEKDPNNPDNLYKQAEIEWRKSQANKNNSGADQKELEGLYAGLKSGKIDPASALDEIDTQTNAGIYTPTQATIMKNLVNQFAKSVPQQPIQQLTPNQISQIEKSGGVNYQEMNDKQIEQAWRTDPTGQKAGTALYDWSAWVRDPRGRMAGVSYPAYQQIYGARLSPG